MVKRRDDPRRALDAATLGELQNVHQYMPMLRERKLAQCVIRLAQYQTGQRTEQTRDFELSNEQPRALSSEL
ncbi:hypothetical protein CR51_18405 [Caballeronia megalochromosomata]|nr:hypothetical protein CR51_18405 [Caballeronia megalochromosomata]